MRKWGRILKRERETGVSTYEQRKKCGIFFLKEERGKIKGKCDKKE
jgi:hypothetical protein